MKTLVLITSALLLAASTASADSILWFEGGPDAYVARGLSKTIRGQDALHVIIDNVEYRSINISYLTKDKITWSLSIRAPKGRTLDAREYSGTLRAENDGTKPWLTFEGEGNGYNDARGVFTILELKYDAKGEVSRLAVNFSLIGENMEKNWLRGALRFNSEIPIKPPAAK